MILTRKWKVIVPILALLGATIWVAQRYGPVWLLQRHLRAEINKKWPPREPQKFQYGSIVTSLANLQTAQMPSVELYFCIGQATLRTVVPDLLKDKFPDVQSATVDLSQQEVLTSIKFTHRDEKLGATLKGSVLIHAATELRNGALVFTPTFSQVTLTSVSVKHFGELSVLVPLINSALATFIQNLSAGLQQETDQIPFSFVRSVTPKDVLGDDNFDNLQGNTISLASAVGTSALFIDKEGVHAIANLITLTPARFKKVIAELRKGKPATSDSLTSEQIAVLSQCDSRPSIHTAEEQKDYLEFKSFCSEIADATKHPLSSSGPSSVRPDQVEAEYVTLGNLFKKRASEIDALDALGWSHTGISVSKSFIASALNEFAGDPHYSGTYRPTNFPFSFRQEVRSEKAPDLKCDDIGCNPDFGQCEPHWNCEGRGCPSDCAWYDVGCHAWKPVCEGLKAAEKGGCEVDKGRFRLQCNVAKQAEKTECEARKAGCQANQKWLNTWSEMQIGLAEGTGEVQHLGVAFEVKTVNVDNSLTRFTVVSTFNATANVKGTVQFTPRDYGNLACIGQWQGDVEGEVSLSPSEFSVVSMFQNATKVGNGLALSFSSQAFPVKLKMSPPPFQALLDHNPKLYIQCAGGVIGKLFGAGSRDVFDYQVPPRNIVMNIPGTEFVAFGTTLYLHPQWVGEGKTIKLVFDSPRWNV